MKFFKISFETAIWRFYLMMAVTLIPFYVGIPMLAIFAAPIFLSIMLGISFKSAPTKQREESPTTVSPILYQVA